jgi:hypothetical protein
MKVFLLLVLTLAAVASAQDQDYNCQVPLSAALGNCSVCYSGYYVGSDGICVVGSSTCLNYTSDGTGSCSACYSSNDYIDNTSSSPYLCVAASGTCATINLDGTCKTCWWG